MYISRDQKQCLVFTWEVVQLYNRNVVFKYVV